MSKNIAGILGISGALLATVFGGFLLVLAAPPSISFTIDGSSTSTFTAGESKAFAIQIANTDEVTVDADIYILDDSDSEVSGISNVSCGEGEDVSNLSFEPIIFCFWDPALAASDEVSFDVTINDSGTYTLVVVTYSDDPLSDGEEKTFPFDQIHYLYPFIFIIFHIKHITGFHGK